MRRTLLATVVVMATMVGLAPAPVKADHSALLHSILYCAEGNTTGACGNGWRGMQATMPVQLRNVDYGAGGVSVTSIYIIGPGGVCYAPCQGDFVEFGWYQEGQFPNESTRFFMLLVSNGLEINCPGYGGKNSYEINTPGTGNYRFRIRQTSDAPGNFKFAYKVPGASNWIAFGCTWTQTWGATAGQARTSTETYHQFANGKDEAGVGHIDVWVQLSTNYIWYAANDTTGYPLLTNYFGLWDTIDYYSAFKVGHGGSVGDEIVYYFDFT